MNHGQSFDGDISKKVLLEKLDEKYNPKSCKECKSQPGYHTLDCSVNGGFHPLQWLPRRKEMTDYTSVKIPKKLTEKFENKQEYLLYRSFSEFVMETIRHRLMDMTDMAKGDKSTWLVNNITLV